MSEQWIQQMRQKMADYKQPAPEVSWDEIEKALDASRARKTRLLWLHRVAAAAVVLLIAGVGYWGLQRNETEQIRPTTASEQPKTNTETPAMTMTTTSLEDATKATVSSIRQKKTEQPLAAVLAEAPLPETETATPFVTETSDSVNTMVKTEKEQPRAVEEKVKPVEPVRRVIYPADLHLHKHIDNRLTAKVYLSNTMRDSRRVESSSYKVPETVIKDYLAYLPHVAVDYAKDENGGTEPADGPVPTSPDGKASFTPVIVYEKTTLYDTITVDRTVNTNQHIHHRQPVRFGFSLRYKLDDCWSIESGLSFTHLSSDITTTVDNVTTLTEQRLNYLGVPLNISYELLKHRQFGLYVTAGGTIEKRLDASPWQFSLNGVAGAEYKLTNIFSLYAEPGIGYYFNDRSSTPTIYKDHPLNFNLSFGLRFNLNGK